MISLRLSEEEYAALRTHSSSCGARSISDLARLALQRVLTQSPTSQAELLAKLNDMDHRLDTMEVHLAHLLERDKVLV
jgi:hypothetical protein